MAVSKSQGNRVDTSGFAGKIKNDKWIRKIHRPLEVVVLGEVVACQRDRFELTCIAT
jgi:hypothetical protein